jgi:hypothetical protein
MIKPYFYVGLCLWALVACEFKRADTSKMSNEMHARQIKHITPSQVVALANDWGGVIKNELNRDILKTLQTSSVIDTLQRRYKASIKLYSAKDINNTAIDTKIRELLDAYLYNAQNGIPQEDNLQKLQNGEVILYTSPLNFDASLSSQKKTILTQLGQKYNIDSLAFQKKGDLVGVWGVSFNRKDIISQIEVKAFGKMKVKK